MVHNFLYFLVLVLLTWCAGQAFAATEQNSAQSQTTLVHTLGGMEQGYGDQRLFIKSLLGALDATVDDYGPYSLSHETLPMKPDRMFKSLVSGKLDVVWTMTSKDRESMSIPVRVPLTYGLFGYRVLLINTPINIDTSTSDVAGWLKTKKAVQGRTWPDTDVLRHNGYTVRTVHTKKDIFKLLDQGYFDYFPRSILEIDEELSMIKSYKVSLQVDPNYALYYPSAMFFFVTPERPELAKRIEEGLHRMTDSGKRRALFDSYISERPAYQSLREKTIVELENPFLSDQSLSALKDSNHAIHFDKQLN